MSGDKGAQSVGGNGGQSAEGARPLHGWDPAQPLTAWLSAVEQVNAMTFSSMGRAAELGLAQWRMVRDALSMLSELPLQALEESTRELARLREAVKVVQLQMAVFDDQLAAMQEVVGPLKRWVDAWRELTGQAKTW